MAESASPETRPTPSRRLPVIWVAQSFWMDPIYHGIARYAAEHGWALDAAMRWTRADTYRPALKPDGIIAFTGDNPELEKTIRSFGVPIVDIEDYVDRYGAAKVLGDDRAVGRMAARHLATCTPSRLVAIMPNNPESKLPIWRTRMEAFQEEAAETGLPVIAVPIGAFDPVELSRDGPVAVFAGGDTMAVEILRRCVDAGVDVPGSVTLLGCDDTPFLCDLAIVPLSSVKVDGEDKGRRAAELLHQLLKGAPKPAGPVILPPVGITVRTSTSRNRTGHEALDRLVRHLQENAHRNIGVDRLCEEAGITRRSAYALMKAKMDTTPLDLLTRFRLLAAERLARTSRMKVDDLARAAGFGGKAAYYRARRAGGKDLPEG